MKKIVKAEKGAKLRVTVESDRKSQNIRTVSVYDYRTHEDWTHEKISSRGIWGFDDLKDMKETLNWNLNGDSLLYAFIWGQSGGRKSTGYAFIKD